MADKYVRVARDTHESNRTAVKCAAGVTVEVGLHQGSYPSPLLFVMQRLAMRHCDLQWATGGTFILTGFFLQKAGFLYCLHRNRRFWWSSKICLTNDHERTQKLEKRSGERREFTLMCMHSADATDYLEWLKVK